MRLRDRVAMYLRRDGPTKAFSKFINNPRKIRVLFSDNEPHFYDVERAIPDDEFVDFIGQITGQSSEEILTRRREIQADDIFQNEMVERLRGTNERPDELHSNWREALYVLVRFFTPDIVVETGVYDGLSSAYILRGIDKGGGGRLISIDINDSQLLPTDLDADAGWVVPEFLRHYWDLRYGDSREILPEIVESTEIDIFIHDSLHTEEHMRFEFETAAKSMKAGALLLSDNVAFNSAFEDFSAMRMNNVSYLKNTEGTLSHHGKQIEDMLGGGVIAK